VRARIELVPERAENATTILDGDAIGELYVWRVPDGA
jgi:hypothetical protein